MPSWRARVLPYFYSIGVVAITISVRMAVSHWTGKGAPFVIFFGAVLISAFVWGVGPGLLAGIVATPVAAYLFVYQAGYTLAQTIAQSTIFVLEISAICILANRFAHAKQNAEKSAQEAERSASRALYSEIELKRVAFELKEAQRLAHIGSWSCDASGGTMDWSEGMYHLLGWDVGLPAPTYLDYPNIYTRESTLQLKAAIERILRDGTPYEIELEFRRPDGSRQLLLGRAEALRDSSGKIIRIRGMVNDVTLLKELQRSREEWTSVIAHDLRQPIAVIGMCAEALPRFHESGAAEKESKTWQRVRAESKSLARMVDDLLDVSRMDIAKLALDKMWTDPRELVKESLERLRYLTHGFEVRVTENGELGPVYVDRGRFEQVIGNLISNAAKYGDPGSEILIHSEENDQGLEISVTNHGRGIPAEECAHLFERYWRSTATQGGRVPGLGLGLYISKGIIEAHDGTISVESVPGELTTFRINIPARSSRQSAQVAS